jgi:uncharacterized protein YbcI
MPTAGAAFRYNTFNSNLPTSSQAIHERLREQVSLAVSCRAGQPFGQPTGTSDAFEVSMKTQGEIEAAICEGIAHFEQEYMGRGPKDIHAHLIGDFLVVRLKGGLTAAEQQLVKSSPAAKGRDLFKGVRTQLIETARPILDALVQDVTGVKVLSLHHDISTVTGEEVLLFTLAGLPALREPKKKK